MLLWSCALTHRKWVSMHLEGNQEHWLWLMDIHPLVFSSWWEYQISMHSSHSLPSGSISNFLSIIPLNNLGKNETKRTDTLCKKMTYWITNLVLAGQVRLLRWLPFQIRQIYCLYIWWFHPSHGCSCCKSDGCRPTSSPTQYFWLSFFQPLLVCVTLQPQHILSCRHI